MKKLVTILLALAMILTLSISVFATDNEKTLITINPTGTNEQRTYKAYKLLNLSIGHKEEGHDYQCPGPGNHVDECYNYNYTINPTYIAILQKEVYNHTDASFWTALGITRPQEKDINEKHILEYLSKLIGDTGSNYSTLRKTADRIYRDILDAKLEPDATIAPNAEGVIQASVDKGYWMIVDAENLANENDANSVVMITTNAHSEIKITPKTSLPEVEKKVKDIDDSESADITDKAWQDSADHDINDSILFKLTATLPNNMDSYKEYKLVFHDIMDAGFTLKPETIKIYVYNNKNTADIDNDMNNSITGVTPIFAVPEGHQAGENYYFTSDHYVIDVAPEDGESDCTFELTINDAKKLKVGDNVYAVGGNAIVITYEATLNKNAVLGKAGNKNEVYLEFSNDPYSTSTGKTAKDQVVVFTYGLTINKVDGHNHALKGAGFTLEKYSAAAGDYVPVGEEIKGEDLTTFVWEGLDDGDYRLKETTVPSGYNGMDPIAFTINAVHTTNTATPELVSVVSEIMGNGDDNGMITKEIVNNTGTILPSTGAEGTFLLITVGAVLVIMSAVFMITRKKMSVYED